MPIVYACMYCICESNSVELQINVFIIMYVIKNNINWMQYIKLRFTITLTTKLQTAITQEVIAIAHLGPYYKHVKNKTSTDNNGMNMKMLNKKPHNLLNNY